MKKIFTILLIGCVISCSNIINEQPLAIDMLGEYEVVSAITNQAIDGDFDGAYSNNFLSEFSSHRSRYIPTLKISRYTDERLVTASCSFPIMFRFPAAFASTSTLIQQRHVVAVVNHSNNKIDKSYPMKDRDGIDTNTKIIDFQIIAENTVKIIVNHESIYNKVTASWQTVAVEFIFKKV